MDELNMPLEYRWKTIAFENGSLVVKYVDLPSAKITPEQYWAELNERMPD